MEEKTNQFPTEEVTLPSKGLLYSKDSPLSKGYIEMKYMTAREEDILTNQNLIQKGIVIDELLKSLIVTENVDYKDLMLDNTKEIEDKTMDESLIIDGQNEFSYSLPTSKIEVTFKLLTHGDEKALENELKGLRKLNKNSSPDVSTRMKHMITSVSGDRERKTIREFVDTTLLARDARELRNYSSDIQPDVDLSFEYEDARGDLQKVDIPIEVQFFWPDASI